MESNLMDHMGGRKTNRRVGRCVAAALALCLSLLSVSAGLAAPMAQGDAWWGPQGQHAVAPWPFDTQPDGALVSNPNPSDRLHLRTQPSKDGLSLGRYYNGVQVQVTGPQQDGWVPVRLGVLAGFMMAQFLQMPGQGVAPLSAMPVMQVHTPSGTDKLHLRLEQSTASPSLGLYPNGTPVIVMGFDSLWAHVIVEGQIGFMMGRYLQ